MWLSRPDGACLVPQLRKSARSLQVCIYRAHRAAVSLIPWSGSTYDLGDTSAATQIGSGRPEDGGPPGPPGSPPGPLREPPERPEEPTGTWYSWFRSLFVTEQPFEGSGRGEGVKTEMDMTEPSSGMHTVMLLCCCFRSECLTHSAIPR
jgi:hypothetical protein